METISDFKEESYPINDNTICAYTDGAKTAFDALIQLCTMSEEERNFLFGNSDILAILKDNTPRSLFQTIRHKDERLSQRLNVGDVVKSRFDNNIIVTWVDKDQIHFDGIWDGGPNRGRTISNRTLTDLGAQKDTSYEAQDIYCLKVDKYNWE